jgi:hypothetical protein
MSKISDETSEWAAITVKTIAIASPAPPMVKISFRFPVMIASLLLLSGGRWIHFFRLFIKSAAGAQD